MRVLLGDALNKLGFDHRIVSPPLAIAPPTALIRRRRVPKRQQTVKVEPLDRLHRTPLLEAARE